MREEKVDFRELYRSGDIVYYVSINQMTGTKDLLELKVRTVYENSIVASEDRGTCYMIGTTSSDWIFRDKREAEVYYKDVEVEAKYGGK